MYEYLRVPAGRKVSPLFKEGHFRCDCCGRELSINYEHLERLENRDVLKCIFCSCPLFIDDNDRKLLSALISRLTVRDQCLWGVGGPWLTTASGYMLTGDPSGKWMWLSFWLVMFFVTRMEAERPPLQIVLKRFVPEVKKRYRRQWRMAQ